MFEMPVKAKAVASEPQPLCDPIGSSVATRQSGWLAAPNPQARGGLGCRLSRSLPTGLLWILEYENVGWQEPACLGAAEQPRRLPKFGLTILPADRSSLEKTGRCISA